MVSSVWRTETPIGALFFHPTRSSEAPGCLRKSSSGSMDKVRGLPPRPSQVTKSKSDAKVNYSTADIPFEEEVVESVKDKTETGGTEKELEMAFPEIEAIREEIVVARSSVKTPKAEEVVESVKDKTETGGTEK